MNFLILKHHFAEDVGNLSTWFSMQKMSWQTIEFDEPLPTDLSHFSGLVVLGGPMHVDASHQRLARELKLIEHFIKAGKPTLGICLGAQLIAFTLGSKIKKMPSPEQGWQPITTHDEKKLLVAQWHEQEVSLPNQAVLLASSSNCAVQMFQYQQHVLATQFHPEWNNVAIRKLQGTFGHDCPLSEVELTLEKSIEKWWFKMLNDWIKRIKF
ncbi:GMP synthase-Glutamine amidotransferase domain [Pseudoalteromonas luteoviolacea B = ATCC 29581]|nr:GMP synthase-Glutamine amidotransferase domain [Pseudoalteromonas luteoviolacea B = ATCC 29581]